MERLAPPQDKTVHLEDQAGGAEGAAGSYPLVVDLDHTLLLVDTLYELFALALFQSPITALRTLVALLKGKAAFKTALCSVASLDVETLPVRQDVAEFLAAEHERGRPIHLATAAERAIADKVVERFPIFQSVQCTEDGHNLKGDAKARRLCERFPEGFSYLGDHQDDLHVWRCAKTALVVSRSKGLEEQVRSEGIEVERVFRDQSGQASAWLRAFRPHQWAKNLVVLVPVALGWYGADAALASQAFIAMLLLCLIASLTYCLNDIADLSADRRHWSKRNRPFASGALPVKGGLILVCVGIPVLLMLGLLISAKVAICLAAYVAITVSYSLGLKRIPLLDTFIIAILFTIRILLGIAAAALAPSAWLITFSMFFFFSLAVAKRHTELLRAGERMSGLIEGRGYHVEDRDVTLVFGIVASMASVLIVVIYLVEEVFARAMYSEPQWLWIAPATIFLFTARVWLLSHRGLMTDDPVAFALKDRVSIGLGLLVGLGLLLAI
jgi:4-hydroxybenzoate polyprenyltransferase